MHFGELTGVRSTRRAASSRSRAATPAPGVRRRGTQLLEFDRDGKFIREIGKNLYAWSYGTPCASIRRTTSGHDKGSTWWCASTRRPRDDAVRPQQEASDKETGPLERHKPPLPPDVGRFRQVTTSPGIRRATSSSATLHQLARREADRNGNWLKSFGDRARGPAAQHAAQHRRRRQGQHLRRRPATAHPVFDGEGNVLREIRIDVPFPPDSKPAIGATPNVEKIQAAGLPLTMAPGAPWAVCITPGRTRCCSPPTPGGRVYSSASTAKC